MNGEIIFLTNVGSRDLKVPSCPSLVEKTKEMGKHIKENLELFKDEIELPIIMPCLIRVSEYTEKIDKIILFVTDQEPSHRCDTIYTGEIIKKVLLEPQNFKKIQEIFENKEKFNKFKEKLPRSEKGIRLKKITKGANDYDIMIKFYKDCFNELKKIYRNNIKKEISKIYISITGGTPASNIGLLWGAIEVFREKVITLYVKEGTAHAFELKIGEIVLESFIEETKGNLLRSKIFRTIDEFEKNKVKKNLIKYIQERLNFNFDLAKKYLEEVEKEANLEERMYITNQYTELSLISNPEEKLNELYFNLNYKYQMGEYVDFLGRVYSFLENLLGYVVNKKLEIDVKDDKRFEESIKSKGECTLI